MKLADFDTATSERPIDETESSLHNNDGSRTYCKSQYPNTLLLLLIHLFRCSRGLQIRNLSRHDHNADSFVIRYLVSWLRFQ